MRIALVPTEIAGQMGILCHGLRQLGLKTNGYNWFHTYIGYKQHVISTDAYELAKMVDPLVQYCDVIHFNNGNTMLLHNADLPFINQTGKKLVMHHWGNDVRTVAEVTRRNPYPLPPSYLTDEQIQHRLNFLTQFIDTAIIQDHEVLPYVKPYYKNVHVLPLACDIQSFKPKYPDSNSSRAVIIHAPTNRAFKGSSYIESAIAKLRAENDNFTFQTVEKMSHSEALRIYLSADIIIDQVLCGTYGMLSVEAMAMGKVVVAFIRDDVKIGFPSDLPIVNANPENLTEVLRNLLENPVLRHKLGKASRRYVEKHHDVKQVAKRLLDIYQHL